MYSFGNTEAGRGTHEPVYKIYQFHQYGDISFSHGILGINSMIGNGWIQYVFTAVLVVTGSAVFAVIMQKILAVVGRQIRVRKA